MLPGRHSVTRQPLGTKDTNRPRGQQNLSATEQSVVKTPCMSSIDSEPALFSTSDPDPNSSQQVEVSTPSLPLPSGKKLQIQQNLPVHPKKIRLAGENNLPPLESSPLSSDLPIELVLIAEPCTADDGSPTEQIPCDSTLPFVASCSEQGAAGNVPGSTQIKSLVTRKYKKRCPALSSRNSCSTCHKFVSATSRTFNSSNGVFCFTCTRKENQIKLLQKKLKTSRQSTVRVKGHLKVKRTYDRLLVEGIYF